MIASALLLGGLAVPAYRVASNGTLGSALAAQIMLAVGAVTANVVTAVLLCEVFPTRVRYTASAVTYNVAYPIFGGTAPFVATWLIATTDNRLAPAIYVSFVAGVAFGVALLTPETAGRRFDAAEGAAPEVRTGRPVAARSRCSSTCRGSRSRWSSAATACRSPSASCRRPARSGAARRGRGAAAERSSPARHRRGDRRLPVLLPQQRHEQRAKEIVLETCPTPSSRSSGGREHDPRIRALLQRGDELLYRPEDRLLPQQPRDPAARRRRRLEAPHHAVERRHLDHREPAPAADRPAAVGPGRRRHRRRAGGRDGGGDNIITIDIGGTSADISVIPGGAVRIKNPRDTEVAGLPVLVPMIDIVTIGAGGGSIAYIDEAGGFRVGPRSAGAVPGPGLLRQGRRGADGDRRAGGARPHGPRAFPRRRSGDRRLAVGKAIAEHIAEPLGLSRSSEPRSAS